MSYKALAAWVLGALLAVPLFTMPAAASDWNRKTVVKISEPVEIPGRVLPAGEYVMRLANVPENRDIVQIFNKNESRLIATVLAVPDFRLTPTSGTVITLEQRNPKSPEAIKSWFYPGDTIGYDFIYPPENPAPAASQPSVAAARVTQPPRP